MKSIANLNMTLQTRLPAACDLGEHAVSLGVTSKTYGLAGLRIGWIATKNKKIYDKWHRSRITLRSATLPRVNFSPKLPCAIDKNCGA